MKIDPLAPQGTSAPADAARRAAPQTPVTSVPAPDTGSAVAATPRADSLELSDAAKTLAAQSTPAAGSSLAPGRLRQVLDRLKSGYYDSAAVRDTVARRVQPDLPAE